MSRRPLGPVAASLEQDSRLQGRVKPGLKAVKAPDRKHVAGEVRRDFEDSLNTDEAFLDEAAEEPRWDYLLGHGPTRSVIGLEVHPATAGEVDRVIRKKTAAEERLRTHLKPGRNVAAWYWAASGPVALTPFSRIQARLVQKGVQFVGRTLNRTVLERDLGP